LDIYALLNDLTVVLVLVLVSSLVLSCLVFLFCFVLFAYRPGEFADGKGKGWFFFLSGCGFVVDVYSLLLFSCSVVEYIGLPKAS